MQNTYSYHQSTVTETLEPHMYIDQYANPEVKDIFHSYKFAANELESKYITAKKLLLRKTLDICLEVYIRSKKGMIIYSTPPSTMFARGEKKIDSMFELLHEASLRLIELVQKSPDVCTHTRSIFSISQKFLTEKRAQHIDGTRKSRTKNLNSRYAISTFHILYMYYCIYIRKIQHFSYVIIDDVSSTGATLVSCKDAVLRTMSLIHRKNPHISYDVKIFSLSH